MSEQPGPSSSSRWVGLLHDLKPLLLCAALFWWTPLDVQTFMQLLDAAEAL